MRAKIFTLIISTFFLQGNLFSQNYFGVIYSFKNAQNKNVFWNPYTSEYLEHLEGFQSPNRRKQLGIKEINLISTHKKNQPINTNVIYNNEGRILSSKNEKYESRYIYLFDTLMIEKFTVEKGKTTLTKKNFNDNNKILLDEFYVNGKLKTKTENTYLNSNLVYAKLFYKRKNYEMKYTFNESNDLIKSEFLKNGRTKQIWNYECKPEGTALIANKNEIISSICEYKSESLDGSYANFTRTIREGKPYLKKETFSKDSIKLKEETFINNDELISETIFKLDSITTNRYQKGEIRYTEIKISDSVNHTLEQINYKKNKLKSAEFTKFNEFQKVVIQEHFYGKNKKLTYFKHYDYDEMGNLLLEETSHDHDQQVEYKRVYEYNSNKTIKSVHFYIKGKSFNSKEYSYVY